MEETCVHHWMIGIPNGPYSLGECRVCKERRLFANSMPDGPWLNPRKKEKKE